MAIPKTMIVTVAIAITSTVETSMACDQSAGPPEAVKLTAAIPVKCIDGDRSAHNDRAGNPP